MKVWFHRRLLWHAGDSCRACVTAYSRVDLFERPVCPPEAGEILRALSSRRHDGSLLAISTKSAEAALRHLTTWSLLDGFTWEDACRAVVEGISLVVTATRLTVLVRSVTEIAYMKSSVRGWMLRPF